MSLLRKRYYFLLSILLLVLIPLAQADNLEKGISLYNEKLFSKAFPIIEEEARLGNAEAQYYLGKMYRRGEGTE